MSHRKTGLSGLSNQALSKKLISPQSGSPLLGAATKAGRTSLNKLVGIESTSIASQPKENSIQFGRPSSTSNSSAQVSGSAWKSLLSNAMSGGVSGALGAFSGMGGLVSDLAGMFGGSSKPEPPSLTLFNVPSSRQETSYLHTAPISTQAASTGPVYTATSVKSSEAQSSATNIMDTTAIAAAVKKALLTSNSLGDVIAEL